MQHCTVQRAGAKPSGKVDPGPLEQADPTQKSNVSVKNSFLTNLSLKFRQF